jgi:signal transduction histidine kinase
MQLRLRPGEMGGMAWRFTDPQLESEARRMAGLATILVWLTAVVSLFAVVGGYATTRYRDEGENVAMEVARIQGEALALAQGLSIHAPFAREVLTATLADTVRYDNPPDRKSDRYAIYDRAHALLAEIGSPPPWPVMRIEMPLRNDKVDLGTVVVEQSLQPLIRDCCLVALATALLSALALLVFRALPINAFYRTMVRLDQAQLARARAESGLRAHVVELEQSKGALQETTDRLQVALDAAAESSQAKSQFLATMSHELRTPLNAIIGFSEIMENEMFGPVSNERYLEYINLINGSGRHLLALVNEVLDLSKAGAGKLEIYDGQIDLALLARDLIRTMQATADNAHVEIISKVSTNMPHLRADPQRITQVLLNLISNAIKFNVASGTVIIEADCQPNDGFTISVTDSGIGIATEDIPKALERFGQIEDSFTRRHQGTGLGLPISKKLVELHGGTLLLKSAVGEGTCVTVWLPPERIITPTAPLVRAV